MRESFARRRTCKACPDSRPDIATPAGYSSLLARRGKILFFSPPPTTPPPPFPLRFPRPAGFASGDCLALNCLAGAFRCSEHISTPKNPASKRISAFLWVFCPFLGIAERVRPRVKLHIVAYWTIDTIRSGYCVEDVGSLAHR